MLNESIFQLMILSQELKEVGPTLTINPRLVAISEPASDSLKTHTHARTHYTCSQLLPVCFLLIYNSPTEAYRIPSKTV